MRGYPGSVEVAPPHRSGPVAEEALARPPAVPAPRPPPRRGGFGSLPSLLGLVAGLLIGALAPMATAAAQAAPTEFDLLQQQRRYEAELKTCEAAVLARDVDQPLYDQLLARVNAARASGDEEAWEEAQRRFLEHSQVLGARQRRVRETCEAAEEARATYLAALDGRRRLLERELGDASEPARRQDLQRLIADIHARYEELEEARSGLEALPVMRPPIEIHRTDTPDVVRSKAAFQEDMIAMADSALAALDDEIERLESRLEAERRRENFQASNRRFGDIVPPVASNPPDREGAGAGAGPSLEDRIRELRSAREQLEYYRGEMVVRLREFRDYLRGIT